MTKTFLICDVVWLSFSVLVCLGSLKLGLGSIQEPSAGFMPFLAGLLLALLAILDLISGLIGHHRGEKDTKGTWSDASWNKLLVTIAMLFIYTALMTTLGFSLATFLLLLFLFRVMEPRPWRIVVIVSAITSGLSYLVFRIGLETQLPKGFLGF